MNVKVVEARPIPSATWCSPEILAFGNIWFMAIFVEVLRTDVLKRGSRVKSSNLTNTAWKLENGARKDVSLCYFANMNSHADFRLVWKSVTLNDLERRNDRRRALSSWAVLCSWTFCLRLSNSSHWEWPRGDVRGGNILIAIRWCWYAAMGSVNPPVSAA